MDTTNLTPLEQATVLSLANGAKSLALLNQEEVKAGRVLDLDKITVAVLEQLPYPLAEPFLALMRNFATPEEVEEDGQ